MAIVMMMQGDTYPVPFTLKIEETNEPIVPDMVTEVEVCVGGFLRKTYSEGKILYDENLKEWFFVPTQQETLAMHPGRYTTQARIKFRNGIHSPVKGICIGTIVITDANSTEVI